MILHAPLYRIAHFSKNLLLEKRCLMSKKKTRSIPVYTAEHLAKIIGNKEEMVRSENNNGQSLTAQAVPLIRPEDLMRLPRGMTANLIEPCPWPVLARCPIYTQTPFAEGLDPNPYYRG